MSAANEKAHQKWFPLESNPELVNEYIQNLGFKTQGGYEFVDVFSTEDWALQMINQPVVAVIMLYPLTQVQLDHTDDPSQILGPEEGVWFMKQRIGNACGTVGILHALLNTPEPVRQACFQPNSWLTQFSADTTETTTDPIHRAERLEGDDRIATFHEQTASSERNQTSRGNIDDDIVTHFVAFVHVGGSLYELDGRKKGPVRHGPTSPENLLLDACTTIRTFMDRDPGEVRFTILALAPSAN